MKTTKTTTPIPVQPRAVWELQQDALRAQEVLRGINSYATLNQKVPTELLEELVQLGKKGAI